MFIERLLFLCLVVTLVRPADEKTVAVSNDATKAAADALSDLAARLRLKHEQEKKIITDQKVVSSQGMSAASLTPSLDCSACEVTAREIYYGYQEKSPNDKFRGTELELIEVMEEACSRLNKYSLAQESFGSHLKVFADYKVKYDVQNVEPVQFYSKKEEERYNGVIWRLVKRCEEYVGKFEDAIIEFVRKKAEETELRKFMCLEQTDVCKDEKMKPYRELEKRRRKKWKRKQGFKKMKEKLEKEVNDEETFLEAKRKDFR